VRSALARLGVLAVSKQLVPIAVVSVSSAEVFALHMQAAAYGLHTRLLGSTQDHKRTQMVVGDELRTAHYLCAWEEGQLETLEELAGVPRCCQSAHKQLRQAGYSDATWLLAIAQQAQTVQEVDLRCTPTMNILLRPLGLDIAGYLPCDLHCEDRL